MNATEVRKTGLNSQRMYTGKTAPAACEKPVPAGEGEGSERAPPAYITFPDNF